MESIYHKPWQSSFQEYTLQVVCVAGCLLGSGGSCTQGSCSRGRSSRKHWAAMLVISTDREKGPRGSDSQQVAQRRGPWAGKASSTGDGVPA